MPRNTKKYNGFCRSELVVGKSVYDLPGIGRVLGSMLEEAGYHKSCEVIGKYLKFRKNEGRFRDWLSRTCPAANSRHLDHCCDALRQWVDGHM